MDLFLTLSDADFEQPAEQAFTPLATVNRVSIRVVPNRGRNFGPLLVETYGPLALIVGFVAAWASAVASVHWMVGWLKSHGLSLFGWYRIALAGAVYLAMRLDFFA